MQQTESDLDIRHRQQQQLVEGLKMPATPPGGRNLVLSIDRDMEDVNCRDRDWLLSNIFRPGEDRLLACDQNRRQISTA